VTYMAWSDGVARESGIPYHKVERRHFQELAKRGFEPEEGEFEDVNTSEEKNERPHKLALGSAFRALGSSPAVQQALRLDNITSLMSNAVAILQDLTKQTIVDGGLLTTSSPSVACPSLVRFKPPLRPRILYFWRTSPIRVVNNITFCFFPVVFYDGFLVGLSRFCIKELIEGMGDERFDGRYWSLRLGRSYEETYNGKTHFRDFSGRGYYS
jgi:hypothetical protein